MEQELKDRIFNLISENDVVLFMKGSPQIPLCGFSAKVSSILKHLNVEFSSVDVLTDSLVRNGIKEYANWPTIPQLYIKNDFVGGCDIINELYESGELQDLLNEKGISYEN